MKIKQLIQKHAHALTERYGQHLLPGHRKALDAMLACRSLCGEFYTQCDHCERRDVYPLSCGHRSCPQCQHHLCEAWQQRQQDKLLPVAYFMVTFTIPYELRQTTWEHQTIMYDLLFKASVEALQTVGKNNFQLSFGMTGILHTHKRDKGYHPHIHMVLPGGGLGLKDQRWRSLPQAFIVNEFALATVFRGIFLRMMFEQAMPLPSGLPEQWVTHVRKVGRGKQVMKYLSRYLYRGVISENDILTDECGQVSFRYQNSRTRKMVTIRQPAETFLWSLLKHVLPRGFRRVRDVGFLHGNAKKRLHQIQQCLGVKKVKSPDAKRKLQCRDCKTALTIELVVPSPIPIRFRFYHPRILPAATPPLSAPR